MHLGLREEVWRQDVEKRMQDYTLEKPALENQTKNEQPENSGGK